jgi:hypothetical protein
LSVLAVVLWRRPTTKTAMAPPKTVSASAHPTPGTEVHR